METLLKALDDLTEKELQRFQWFLTTGIVLEGFPPIPRSKLENANQHDTVTKMMDIYGHFGAEKVTLTILKKLNHNHLAEMLESKLAEGRLEKETLIVLAALSSLHSPFQTINISSTSISEYQVFSKQLKDELVQKFERILDGDSETGHKKYLNDIYTDLYIVENETGGVIEEHEVRQIEASSNRPAREEIPIKCNDIFKLQADTNRRNRKVLTMGIAGIGKTFSVTKFILDWAEGNENRDIEFIFPLPFRELNMKKDEQFSLMELLYEFVLHSNELKSLPLGDGKVMFIFDGLDECRFSLNFGDTERLKDIYKKTSLGSIITNLIKRNLLPSALIWITSRPAAAHLIPRDYIDQVTEVRGFNNEQRKEYFYKHCQKELAAKIVTHIMKSRSLYIMCQIPIFCWISASVLKTLLENEEDTPTTLTGMYTKFVLQQSYNMKKKYCKNTSKRFNSEKVLLQLGKLALHNLERGDLIFYEEDLKKCGIDISFVLVYSGVCTQIFRQNPSASGRKTFSFVHLSIQEFFAALYVLHSHCKGIKSNALQPRTFTNIIKWVKKTTADLQRYALSKALTSENGHMDLFVRFLFGLSVESNQHDLRELLPKLKTEMKPKDRRQIVYFIEDNLNSNISIAASLNLLECLREMKDDSLLSGKFNEYSSSHLFDRIHRSQWSTGVQWSLLVYNLLNSEEIQEKFDLKQHAQSSKGLRRLLPVVKITKQAQLDNCNLKIEACIDLASVFSADSPLRELDLCENDIQDTGMELLSDGLRSVHCKLEILRMCYCKLTEKSGQVLASVFTSASSRLRELDVSNNNLQDSGVKFISIGLENPHCKLEILRLSGCLVTKEGCSYLASSLRSNSSSHLIYLDLSYNHPGDTGEEMFYDLLHNPHWKLETVKIAHGGEFRMKPGRLKYACDLTLDPNTANRKLQLYHNYKCVKPIWTHNLTLRTNHHPDRFDHWPQVLCIQPLYGRCYWEATCSGGTAIIAVSYKRINRKELNSCFGKNDVSWCLICTPGGYSVVHNNRTTHIPKPVNMGCETLGVYLDSEAGTLSFYTYISNIRMLLHQLHVKFTEPLYAGFACDVQIPPVIQQPANCIKINDRFIE